MHSVGSYCITTQYCTNPQIKVSLKSCSVITKLHVVILRKNAILNNVENYRIFILLFFSPHGSTSSSGPRTPLWGFTITLRHTKRGRTPLDEWSVRRTDLYLTTHNTHKRQTSVPKAGFETAIPASERPSHKLKPAKYIFLMVKYLIVNN